MIRFLALIFDHIYATYSNPYAAGLTSSIRANLAWKESYTRLYALKSI